MQVSLHSSYPHAADGDPIIWSSWGMLRDENVKHLNFLAYSMGFQIMDGTR